METRRIEEDRYEIRLSKRQLDILRSLAWTVQNTIKENDDVAEEYEENLKFFGVLNRNEDYPVGALKFTFHHVINRLQPADREVEFKYPIL